MPQTYFESMHTKHRKTEHIVLDKNGKHNEEMTKTSRVQFIISISRVL